MGDCDSIRKSKDVTDLDVVLQIFEEIASEFKYIYIVFVSGICFGC
jgi:hypothetical protein